METLQSFTFSEALRKPIMIAVPLNAVSAAETDNYSRYPHVPVQPVQLIRIYLQFPVNAPPLKCKLNCCRKEPVVKEQRRTNRKMTLLT